MKHWFSVIVCAAFLVAMAVPAQARVQDKAAPSKSGPALVNLNAATAAQLEALPGIGPKMAQRIIEYRQKNNGFKKVEDLMNVSGIGEKSFLKLKNLVTVSAPRPEKPGHLEP